jgi:hypothetical protein
MILCIGSWSNEQSRFITDVSICALAVACPHPVQLPVGAIAVSWKSSYIWGISIMILLHLAQGSPEGTYKVVWVIECVLKGEGLGSVSHVMSWVYRMLAVCFTRKEYWLAVNEGSRDIYTRDCTISWFNLFCCLNNTKFPTIHHAQPPGTRWLRKHGMRLSTFSEDCIRHRPLLWYHIPLSPLRPCASPNKLSSCTVDPTV